MDIKAEKEYIKLELDKVEDIHLVEAIKNLLAFGKNKAYEQSMRPMTKEAFFERNEKSRKAIAEDNLISQQEAKDYFARKYAK